LVGGVSGRLLTLAEAAQLVGCSTKTLRRRVASGALTVFRDGRLVRVPEEALAAYVRSRTARPAPGYRPKPAAVHRGPSHSASPKRLFDLPDPLDLSAKLIKDQRPADKCPGGDGLAPGRATGGQS
jgi:excisionase family DNA binding protein